jgi:hypothetical protein
MQALSHFSYHLTGGRYVFCDIQGGIYPNEVVLTDPVILSWDGSYGVTDLGPKGISSFFSSHVCNEFCKRDWLVPHDRTRYFTPKRGSSMMLSGANHHVPTHISWAPAVTNADAAKTKKTEGGTIQEEGDRECCICLEETANHACIPCGHMCLCKGCTAMLLKECPKCRTPVSNFIRIYL